MFDDRVDAGKKLADRLRDRYEDEDAVVLAIPRGGVVVGHEVAKALHLMLDIIVPRKIGAPGNPELAIGAVTKDTLIIDEKLIKELGVSRTYVEEEATRQKQEIDRRRSLYLGDRKPLPVEGRIALIIDDGLATGHTAMAAVEAIKRCHPSRTVLAIPVAPAATYNRFRGLVDDLVCLQVEEIFFAVGQYYRFFDQTTDEEVIEILSQYRQEEMV